MLILATLIISSCNYSKKIFLSKITQTYGIVECINTDEGWFSVVWNCEESQFNSKCWGESFHFIDQFPEVELKDTINLTLKKFKKHEL